MTGPAGLPGALRLIVILDAAGWRGRDPATLAAAAERGGATMLQLRDKSSSPAQVADMTRRIIAATRLPLIVNDRLDIALAAGAAGCHLGQDDLPIDDARRLTPPGFIIGGSAGNEAEARDATRAGAHYLGIGPVRATGNKPDAGAPIGVDGFRRVRETTRLPCVGIGGLGASDVAPLRDAGAAGIAVIGAVLGRDDVEDAVRQLARAS